MSTDTAFSEFAAARWRMLVRAGVLLGCSVEDAEDLAQQTLVRCYVKWRQVCRADDRDGYVARVQLNLLRQTRRRRWLGERPSERLPDRPVADRTAEVEQSQTMVAALAGLPIAQREAVVLRYYLDLSEARIAELTGVAPGTVKSRLSRALQALSAVSDLKSLREGS